MKKLIASLSLLSTLSMPVSSQTDQVEQLTLAAKGDAETVPLNQVKSVDFERDVWIKGAITSFCQPR